MKLTMKLLVLLFGVLLLANVVNAESPREQLKQMVEQLQQSPSDNTLREKIIKMAQELKPAPVVPEEARRYRTRGIAAFETAKSAEDFKLALPEFQNAANAAPWWSDTYFNLAMVQEKMGDLKGAIASYHFYLIADPNAKDAESIRTQSYKLEFMAEQKAKEEATKAKEESAKKQRQAWAAEIVHWLQQNYGGRIVSLYFGSHQNKDEWSSTLDENGKKFQYSISGNDMDQVQIIWPWINGYPYCGIPVNSDVRGVKWRYCGSDVRGQSLMGTGDTGDPMERFFTFSYMSKNNHPRIETVGGTKMSNPFIYELEP